ncbi:MAG TPA: hypothetical protein VH092_11500 [Urbifossiella sp.]|nr:hypothetical protein [Urbifossiella sp.]
MLLLPYIEQQPLFDEFRLTEPWDSEHNLRLLPRMPRTYAAPWTKIVAVPEHHTVLHVFVGPGAAFERCHGLRQRDDFPDGTANMLLYVESEPPVPWTMPGDIPFAPDQPIRLRGLFRRGCRAGTVDGTGYRLIRNDCDERVVRASVSRNGGEPETPAWDR